MRFMLTVATSALALSSSACTLSYTTNIDNPLHDAGSVEANRIELRRSSAEQKYRLPSGTLSYHASLASLDERTACFDIALRSTGNEPGLANPLGLDWELIGEPEVVARGPEVSDVSAMAAKKVAGAIERRATKTERICNNAPRNAKSDAPRCTTKETVVTTVEPADIRVVSRNATMCFDHGGSVHQRTRSIALRYRSGAASWRQFEWKFD